MDYMNYMSDYYEVHEEVVLEIAEFYDNYSEEV